MTIPYEMPRQWLLFDLTAVQVELLGAKAAMLALTQIPYQRSWAEQLQQIQLSEIRLQVAKALYRNTMTDLFGRLRSPRKRVMSDRHVQLLQLLLDHGSQKGAEFIKQTVGLYQVKNLRKALMRDLSYLAELQAVEIKQSADKLDFIIAINLDWPTQITESEFFKRVKEMPKAKVYGFLST
jgi:hypothetical protein